MNDISNVLNVCAQVDLIQNRNSGDIKVKIRQSLKHSLLDDSQSVKISQDCSHV